MKTMEDLTGLRFGCWTVISFQGIRTTPNGTRKYLWNCQCDCGAKGIAAAGPLRNGHSRSCGCLQRKTVTAMNTTHGMSGTPIHLAWLNMKVRCYNPDFIAFKHYGGRGIKVCDRWLHSFENFYADMGNAWKEGLELDRYPDKNGDYEPGNCRWVTHQENMYNTRRNNIVTANGISKPIKKWADELGGNKDLVRERIAYGWSPEKAVSTPIRKSS